MCTQKLRDFNCNGKREVINIIDLREQFGNVIREKTIHLLLSNVPFGGSCGNCLPLRPTTGVLDGLVWTDPVRGCDLRDTYQNKPQPLNDKVILKYHLRTDNITKQTLQHLGPLQSQRETIISFQKKTWLKREFYPLKGSHVKAEDPSISCFYRMLFHTVKPEDVPCAYSCAHGYNSHIHINLFTSQIQLSLLSLYFIKLPWSCSEITRICLTGVMNWGKTMIFDSILTGDLMILTLTFRKQKNLFCTSQIKTFFPEHDLDQNMLIFLLYYVCLS